MSTVTLEDAKLRLGELVKSLPVEGEVVITQGNKPVAKLTMAAPAYSVVDIQPLRLGGMLRPYPHPDDDILGEMIEEKMDKVFPRLYGEK
jgi:antitoxin (DNA-binding transcriptional repressor) of toxin-antitoxin stability system